MYRKAVLYKGVWLAPGSECFELYSLKKMKELDKLMEKIDADYRKLSGLPPKGATVRVFRLRVIETGEIVDIEGEEALMTYTGLKSVPKVHITHLVCGSRQQPFAELYAITELPNPKEVKNAEGDVLLESKR